MRRYLLRLYKSPKRKNHSQSRLLSTHNPVISSILPSAAPSLRTSVFSALLPDVGNGFGYKRIRTRAPEFCSGGGLACGRSGEGFEKELEIAWVGVGGK